MQITGIVHEVSDIDYVSEKISKRDLIVEITDNPKYPEYVRFETINDKCKLLDNLLQGNNVTVDFNMKGRPYTDKTGKKTYFNSLQLWKVNVLGAVSEAPQYAGQADISSSADSDDLPF